MEEWTSAQPEFWQNEDKQTIAFSHLSTLQTEEQLLFYQNTLIHTAVAMKGYSTRFEPNRIKTLVHKYSLRGLMDR